MKLRLAILTAGALATLAAPGRSELLEGRYDAFVDAAATCAAATGPTGVDRSVVSSAGWPELGSFETDDNVLSAGHSRRNPFPLSINADNLLEPERCWLSVDFRVDRDYAEVRSRLERRFGRAPDEVDKKDMRGTRWLNPGNVAELWMLPANDLCPECPTLFFTVTPRSPK